MTTSKNKPIFVIQKHAASHMHYDFRIQVGRVLKSWAVPKGISRNPAVKHLAMPTEDHKLSYATFEGVIPEGSYGAGTVMLWDTGTYKNIKKIDGKLVPIRECLKIGRVEIELDGKKVKGGYALIKTELAGGKWLLIKMNDKYADRTDKPFVHENKSVKTGRTLKQIAKDEKSGKKNG